MVCLTKTKETHSRRSEMINTIDEDEIMVDDDDDVVSKRTLPFS
jgi:hypothetical protein